MDKFNFTTHGVSWTDAMEEYAKEAITKGMKRAITSDMSYVIKVSIVNKKTKLVKVELSSTGFRAQCTGKDFYAAMTAVVAKFKSLVLKHTKKRIATKRKGAAVDYSAEVLAEETDLEELISKEKTFILDPCTVEEAIEAFEQTDYNFYTFRDIDSNNEVAVLYKRFDNTIGVIRCK